MKNNRNNNVITPGAPPPAATEALPAKPKINRRKAVSLIFLVLIGLALIVVFTSTFWGIFFGQDIPSPDDSDLRLSKVEVPDEQNSFSDLVIIGNSSLYYPKGNESFDLQYTNFAQLPQWNQALVDDALSNNQTILDLFAQAAQKTYFQIPEYSDPANYSLTMKLYPMNNWRAAARLFAIQALSYSWQNQPQKAAEAAIKIIRLGNAIQNSQGPVIAYLVGTAIKDLGYQTFLQIIPYGDFTTTQITNYVDQLAYLKQNFEGLKNAFISEHLTQMLGIDSINNGDYTQFLGDPNAADNISQPIIKLAFSHFYFKPNETKQIFNDYIRQQIKMTETDCSNRPEFSSKNETLAPTDKFKMYFTENVVGKLLHDTVALDLTSIQEKRCQENLLYQVTIAMANLRAYKIDHGDLPNSLEELLSSYVTEVPIDVYSAQSLHYDKARKILYSVGIGQKDLGGSAGDNWRTMDNPTFKIKF